MTTEAAYVLFAKKGDYRFAIRTPALTFGSARIHIDRGDGTLVFPQDVAKLFELKGSPPNRDPLGSYVTVSYDPYAETKTGVQTAFLDRRSIGHYPEVLLGPFNRFLDWLGYMGVEVDNEVALGVYRDTVEADLEEGGFYPPKGKPTEVIERISGRIGKLIFTSEKIVKSEG